MGWYNAIIRGWWQELENHGSPECQEVAFKHARHRSDMDWWTCSKIPGVSLILAEVIDIRAARSISELKGVSSIMALKDSCSDVPERTFDDSVAASLDIFIQTTEQRRINFHWVGHR
ncbi:hypothetical protein TNCV_659291 [Trichonephila clavipes]|nr:hypothetical protein TNCV_659291 [Trichonephila clavipes]